MTVNAAAIGQLIDRTTELALTKAPALLAASSVFREQVRREVAELVLREQREERDDDATA